MNKKWTFVAVAAVGVVAIATWSVAQPPSGSPPAKKSPLSSASGDDASAPEVLPKSKLLPGGTIKSGSTRPFTSRSSGIGEGRATSLPAGRTTSAGSTDIDSSLAPFRGSSPPRSESFPSPSPSSGSTSSGTSVRIEHALVTSLDPIKLPARDAGTIRQITVKKGIDIKTDDILGQLDDRESLAKLRIAEKERDAAQVQAENNAQIEAAEKGELVTRENLKANEEIRKKSPGALSDFDMRRSKFEWERALAQIAVAKMEKSIAEATQLAKEAQIDAANVEIERRKIVAPIDGFVNEVYKHVGEWCQPGDPVLELVRMDRLEIEGFVFAADVSPAAVLGKPVDVVVQLAGGGTYKGTSKITFASPVLEGSGRIRQFRVSTEIDNERVPNEKGESSWLIQPGTEAEMIIHISPPAPKPVATPRTTSPAGARSGFKVDAFKPAVPDAGAKSGARSDDKGEKKSDAKGDSTSAKSGDSKSDAKPTVENETKSDAKASKSDKSKSGDEPKDTSKSSDKGAKEAPKTPKIKL